MNCVFFLISRIMKHFPIMISFDCWFHFFLPYLFLFLDHVFPVLRLFQSFKTFIYLSNFLVIIAIFLFYIYIYI